MDSELAILDSSRLSHHNPLRNPGWERPSPPPLEGTGRQGLGRVPLRDP